MNRYLRFISLCVLFCFVGTLGAPILRAQTSSEAAAATITQASQTGLARMWGAWADLIKSAAKPTMDHAAAVNWFKSNGATAQQAQLLATNAAAEGHLVTTLTTVNPSAPEVAAAQAQQNIFQRTWAKLTGKSLAVPEAAVAGTASQGGFFSKITNMFKGGTGTATTGYPTPEYFLKAGNVVQNGAAVNPANLQLTPADIQAGITTTAQKAKIMMGMEAAPAAVQPKTGFFGKFTQGVKNVGAKVGETVKNVGAKIKAGAQKVALTGKRAASDTAQVARTGVLTAADKVAFWQKYYKIPVTDNLGIKIRGELSYTTKFTNKGWVVDKYSTTTQMPGKYQSADALFQIEQASAAVNSSNMGFFSKIAAKIKGGWSKLSGTVSGHKPLTENAKAEMGKMQVENMLLEKARTLNEVSASIEQRISNLEQTSAGLKRAVPAEEIKALRDTQRYVNEQKKVLERKLTEVHDGKAMTVVKDAAKWALYGVGITAGINIARQVFSGEGIDLAAAFSFMGQPTFWGGMAGGFAGSMAGSYLGNMLLGGLVAGLPPGIGLFFRVLPGFLGAALGFEFGGSLFGGEMDLMGTLVQTLGSAVGFTGASMIWTAMMGTAAPGIVLMAAAIASGMLTNWIFNKFRGDPESEAYDPMALPDQQALPPADDGQQLTDQPSDTAAPQGALSVAELQKLRSEAYTKYINLLKDRKITEARSAREEYEKYDQTLKAQLQSNLQ